MTTAAPGAYGTDLSTFDADGVADMDPTFTLIGGPRVVVEAIARRLMTPAGSYQDDPRYGYDLREELGSRLSAVRKIRVAGRIAAQCLEEPRVRAARVVSLDTVSPNALRLVVSVDLGSGPFDLVLGIDAVTVSILRGAT